MDEKHDFSDDEYDYPDSEPNQKWIYDMFPENYPPITIVKDKKTICVRKIKQPNGKYKKCKNTVVTCHWCYRNICPNKECIPQYLIRSYGGCNSKKHEKCLYCDIITCCPSGICYKCEVNHHFDMITENVAIGSYQSSYHPFDIVINLDYPHNNVEKNKIKEYYVESPYRAYVIACGYDDCPNAEDGLSLEKINELLTKIQHLEKEGPKKILFHCYAGISRSVTLAIAYLSKTLNKSTQEIYQLTKEKRPRINPNPFFKQLLDLN
jgi:protein-tyrosine phosphatase